MISNTRREQVREMGRQKSEASCIKLKSNLLWKQKPYDTKTR